MPKINSLFGNMRTTIQLTVVTVFIVATILTASLAIGLQYYFGQSMANTQRNLNGPHSGRGGLTSVSGAAENAPKGTEETTPAHIQSDALVDMFA